MKKIYNEFSQAALSARVSKMIAARKALQEQVAGLHVKFSQGNRKTGAVPSVSLLPVVDCANCRDCARGCYDLRHDMIYNNVIDARATNSAILAADPARYFAEVAAFVRGCRFFRWHIGGDIANGYYFSQMVQIAINNPHCEMLAFTKVYGVVNAWIDEHGELPKNLHIVFSGWKAAKMDNRHNIPTSWPRFADDAENGSIPECAKQCTDNCLECAIAGRLCFGMKAGEAVYFIAH